MASCFFLTRNTVDMYKITKTVIFSRAWEFGFSMSPRDMYYQFYKNAPIVGQYRSVSEQLIEIFTQPKSLHDQHHHHHQSLSPYSRGNTRENTREKTLRKLFNLPRACILHSRFKCVCCLEI